MIHVSPCPGLPFRWSLPLLASSRTFPLPLFDRVAFPVALAQRTTSLPVVLALRLVVHVLKEFTLDVSAHGKKLTHWDTDEPRPQTQKDGPVLLPHQSFVAFTGDALPLVVLRTPAALLALKPLSVIDTAVGKSPGLASLSTLTAAVDVPVMVSCAAVTVALVGWPLYWM